MVNTATFDKKHLGGKVRRIRESYAMTQEELAGTFGWNKQVITDMEAGKALALPRLASLCQYFEMSLDVFLTD